MDTLLLERIEKSGLTAMNDRKLTGQFIELEKAEGLKIVICNCTGFDRNANVGKHLVASKLNDILEGVSICADSIRALEAVFYIGEDFLTEMPEDTTFGNVKITFATGPDTLVSRNHTALTGLLKKRLPRPYAEDTAITRYDEYSALVIDCETAINVFKCSRGLKPQKNLFIAGKGFISADYGTPLTELLEGISADLPKAKGILLGGTLGSFITQSELAGYVINASPLFNSVEIFREDSCIVDTSKNIMAEAFKQSCGKCVLCREATKQFKAILTDITEGKAQAEDLDMMNEMSGLIRIGAFCNFGRQMVNPLTSALSLFRTEFENHIRRRRCDSMVCVKFSSIVILPNECTGCEECLDCCPENAIDGKKGYIHMIDEAVCDKCGKCLEVCPEKAIVKAGAVKPKLPTRLMRVGTFRK